jgi:hypothetical protein
MQLGVAQVTAGARRRAIPDPVTRGQPLLKRDVQPIGANFEADKEANATGSCVWPADSSG